MVKVVFIVGFTNAKGARIANWILEQFILAVIIGLLGNDLFAIISLVVVPIVAYSYVITLVILKKKGIIEISLIKELVNQEGNDSTSDFKVDV